MLGLARQASVGVDRLRLIWDDNDDVRQAGEGAGERTVAQRAARHLGAQRCRQDRHLLREG